MHKKPSEHNSKLLKNKFVYFFFFSHLEDIIVDTSKSEHHNSIETTIEVANEIRELGERFELEKEGLENRWNRCKTLAKGVRNLFSDLGFMLLADAGQQSETVTAIMYPEGMNDTWRSKLKDEYQTQVIGAQDHLKGKMFRVGSMGTTSIDEMIEGCNRMIACFNEMGHTLPNVDVASYFA